MRRLTALVALAFAAVLVLPAVGRAVQQYVLYYVAAERDWTNRSSEPRWVDAGDGTTWDRLTGLQWERKTTDGSIHDVDREFTWSAGFRAADGTAYTELLRELDQECFAGHCDWRLPTRAELATIVAPGPYPCPADCIDPAFGPTDPIGFYWSSTSSPTGEGFAWGVHFESGAIGAGPKSLSRPVRAVRGGF